MIILLIVKGIKLVTGFCISVGVGTLVREGIKKITPEKIGACKKACIFISGAVISSLLYEKIGDYACDKIDHTAEEVAKEILRIKKV
jgi:hypothetical protein